jgi:hypothetical protein
MKHLAGAITMAVVEAFSAEEMLRRLADPWWFQAFGCVLGFDWHSSGLTTVTCGAMKEARKLYGGDLGIVVAGGKGATSRKTPQEIADAADRYAIAGGERLVYASRLSAKVDSAGVQDGYRIYHHSFFLTPSGAWCVVQQGMNGATGLARRYHWLGETVEDFVCEPHNAVTNPVALGRTRPDGADLPLLNMVAREADANRRGSAELARESPDRLLAEVRKATEGPTLFAPSHHAVLPADVNLDRLRRTLTSAHERAPEDFEALLGTKGVGPAAIRSLSLLAELIHGAPASHRDPAAPLADGTDAGSPAADAPGPLGRRRWADYSYAHGGKDGQPFPVDRQTYDRNIQVLLDAVRKARIGQTAKAEALRRLANISPLP